MILTDLTDNFYDKLNKFIKEKKETVENEKSMNNLREFENTVKLLRSIFQIRQQKILLRAIQSGGEDKEGMTKEEIELFTQIKQLMSSHTQIFESVLEKRKEQPKAQFKKIKILKNVPAYTGADGSIYGPFKPEQEKELPETEVNFLLKADMAKLGE